LKNEVESGDTMAKTIKEIADEIGVDKQKVYRFIKQNHINEALHEALRRNGVKYYDEAAEALIKQGLLGDTASSEAHREAHQNRINEAVFDAVIEMLQKELEIKNEQIRELNERLSECSAALLVAQQTAQAAQALHAGTIQKEIASGESGVDKQKSASEKKNRWFKRLFRG
jgi:DNA polymerase III delta prime subunit